MGIKDDVNRLVRPPAPDTSLQPAKLPPAIRDKTGLERKQAGSFATEEVTVQSTDGLFVFTVLVVKV